MASPVVIGALGVAVDFVNYTRVKADLQSAADAAAIAAARELQVANSDDVQVTSAALSYAAHRLIGSADASISDLRAHDLDLTAEVVDASTAVKVDITETWTPFFAHFIDAAITPVKVSATARFVGSGSNICVLGLGEKGTAVNLSQGSRLTGNNCGVYSNSTDASAFRVANGAQLNTSLNCVAGGSAVHGGASVSPTVLTDCPKLDDPLAGRQGPTVGGCDHTAMVIKNEAKTLNPGVYCKGLTVAGTSTVTLNPGTYIIDGGHLNVSGLASLSGEGVSFYLTGDAPAPTIFAQNTHISLSAPTEGAMAGLLFFEDRNIGVSLKHRITSNDARKLVGTIYLPVGELIVDARDPVADQSAYTAIIVNALDLNMGPNLVLNSDYDATNVPVPEGIKGTGQIVLTE